jgi:hypothetical protein
LDDDLTASIARTRTVTWQDPMAAFRAAAGMSGLEFMKPVLAVRSCPP